MTLHKCIYLLDDAELASMTRLIAARVSCELVKVSTQFIAHAPENGHALLIGSHGRRRRIIEAVMQTLHRARKNRAAFFCVVADGNNVVEALPLELIHMFGAMAADVDADLVHRGDGLRPYRARLGPGTFHLEYIPGIVAQQSFRHLAPGGIAGAENQNTFPHT
jgi:hypothetical protein